MITTNGIDGKRKRGGGKFPNEKGLRGSEAKDKNDPFKPPEKSQKKLVQEFIDEIDRLEIRYEGCNYADMWLINKKRLIAVRDHLAKPALFDDI